MSVVTARVEAEAKPQAAGDGAKLPRFSPVLFRWFAWFTRRYLRRHFHGVRLLRGDRPTFPADEPVVIYLNHPAWWDPLMGMLLADVLMPDRKHAVPIDADMLATYRLFARLGFFGVPKDPRRGATAFLRHSQAVLADNWALWVTAEGRFTDVRQRPVTLEPGLAHLARRMSRGVIVPLAVEYGFWNQRTPEALLHFGEPMHPGEADLDLDTWQRLLSSQLQAAMDTLAAAAMTRDPQRFDTLIDGAVGVGGVYDLLRRGRAAWRGEPFDPTHRA